MNRITKGFLLKGAALVFVVFCLCTIVKLQFDNNAIKNEFAEESAKYDEISEHVEELQRQNEKPFDAEYIAEIAKEKLGYRFPDECVFYNDN